MKCLIFLFFFLISSLSWGEENNQEPSESSNNIKLLSPKINIAYSSMSGGVYYGGRKAKASFNNYSIGLDFNLNDFIFGLEVNILRNQSVFQAEQILLTGGYSHSVFPNFELFGKGKLGLGFMREVTQVYKAESYSGRTLGVEAGVLYSLPINQLKVGISLDWLHQMHSSSFYGSEQNDVVLEQFGPKLVIQYNF